MREPIDMAVIQEDFDRIARASGADADEGWNHNNQYHRFLLQQMPARCREALDIGCGTGEFARLLAERADHVLGLDLSPRTIELARGRSTGRLNLDFESADVFAWRCEPERFDVIVSIATLHHMSMDAVLPRLKEALARGGTLLILDVYQQRFSDLFVNLVATPANLFMQAFKNGRRSAVSAEARAAMQEHQAHDSYLTLPQVRQVCQTFLPGARVRRHVFWRYSITWRKPG